MENIAISTSAFCLWDIGPERKLDICRDLGFEHIVIAFSTLKMLKHFANSDKLCKHLSSFQSISIHAPWCGVKYKDNKATKQVVDLINGLSKKITVSSVIFHFDCIDDFEWLQTCHFPYCFKNPAHHSWDKFNATMNEHGFDCVLDINRATRFENYLEDFIRDYKGDFKAVHVSGYVDDLGRMPIVESQQEHLLTTFRLLMHQSSLKAYSHQVISKASEMKYKSYKNMYLVHKPNALPSSSTEEGVNNFFKFLLFLHRNRLHLFKHFTKVDIISLLNRLYRIK